MSEFKWHLMAEEQPEYGENDYLVMGIRGALYVACKYDRYSAGGKGEYFYIQNNRSNFMDSEKVLAWAEIPPLEVSE